MEIISKSCNYGIRSLLFLASSSPANGEYVSVRVIGDELGISFYFLSKVLHKLTTAGILESSRGATGGVRLKKDPDQLTLLELIYILDGKDYFNTCFLGLRGCGMHAPCPMHDYWTDIKTELKQKFSKTYVGSLGKDIINEGFRISRDTDRPPRF